jgi:hypothetical protein
MHTTGSISAQNLTAVGTGSFASIGIGTNSPDTNLDVRSTATPYLRLGLTKSSGLSAEDSIGIYEVYGSDNTLNYIRASQIVTVHNQTPTGLEQLNPRIDFKLYDYAGGINSTLTKMSILNSGLVGIGTKNPQAHLHVTGSISSATLSAGSIKTTDITINNSLYANEIAAAVKHFVIPHPLKKGNVLVHGSLEGPENGVFYRGISKLKNGTSTVKLPDYFNKLVHKENITVHLQTINEYEDIYIKEINYENNEFIVICRKKKFIEKLIMGKSKDIEFNWIVFAERKDTPKLRIEK